MIGVGKCDIYSFKGPSRACLFRTSFSVLLYDSSQLSFFFQFFFARVWSFIIRFLRKGNQTDEQSLKESKIPTRTLVLMFKQVRTCSQFFDMMRYTPGHLLVYASGCRKCVVQSILAGYSPNSVWVLNHFFKFLK